MDPRIAAIGLLLGFLSGLFGVGGSSVATPLLRLAGVARLSALASPLPAAIPAALAGAYASWRHGRVDMRTVGWTALGGIPLVLLGSLWSERVPGRLLMLLAGLAVLAAGIRILLTPSRVAPPRRLHPLAIVALGGGVGFLSGLLANGGGFLLAPAYLVLLGMEPQSAAASSLTAVAFLSLPGTVVHAALGHVDPGIALTLAACVLPTTYLGARLSERMSPAASSRLFGAFLLLFGALFVIRTLLRVESMGWE